MDLMIFSMLDSRCWMALMNHCAEDSLLLRYCRVDLSIEAFCELCCTISAQDWLMCRLLDRWRYRATSSCSPSSRTTKSGRMDGLACMVVFSGLKGLVFSLASKP